MAPYRQHQWSEPWQSVPRAVFECWGVSTFIIIGLLGGLIIIQQLIFIAYCSILLTDAFQVPLATGINLSCCVFHLHNVGSIVKGLQQPTVKLSFSLTSLFLWLPPPPPDTHSSDFLQFSTNTSITSLLYHSATTEPEYLLSFQLLH